MNYTVVENGLNIEMPAKRRVDNRVFGKKIGIINKLLGCWHENLSRPFNEQNTHYRVCLECGARRQFDRQSMKTYGAFYHPPVGTPQYKF